MSKTIKLVADLNTGRPCIEMTFSDEHEAERWKATMLAKGWSEANEFSDENRRMVEGGNRRP